MEFSANWRASLEQRRTSGGKDSSTARLYFTGNPI